MQHSIECIKTMLPKKINIALSRGIGFQCNFEWAHKPLQIINWDDFFEGVDHGEFYEIGYIDYNGREDNLAISPLRPEIVGISDDCDETELMLYGSSALNLCNLIMAFQKIGESKEEITSKHHDMLRAIDGKYDDTVWHGLIRHIIEDY